MNISDPPSTHSEPDRAMSPEDSAQPRLLVRLLGDFRVAVSEQGETPGNLTSLRLQALLAYLLLHRDAPQSRQHIAFLFWPDSSEEQALANLRNLVFQLRHAFPGAECYLITDNRTLQWNRQSPVRLDVADFQHELSQVIWPETGVHNATLAHLKRAVELYTGDLLPNCYDEWILPERDALQDQYKRALKQLYTTFEALRDYPRAIEYCQKFLQSELLAESAYADLMRLYSLSGDRARALHTYHACATILQRELEVSPGPSIQSAYESLLNLDAHPAEIHAPANAEYVAATSLIGRQNEWATLHAAWRSGSAGKSDVILLSGEAGIGKTRLAEELIDWAHRQGSATAVSRCYSSEGTLPLSPVIGWLRSRPYSQLPALWLTEIARLLPETLVQRPDVPAPGPLTEPWQRIRLFEALAKGILCGSQPLLLLLDDIQWADRDTLEWIQYFLNYDKDFRILIVFTLRNDELDPLNQTGPLYALLNDLRRSGQLAEMELHPLSAAETAKLASGVAGRTVEEHLQNRIYNETEGNPLFIIETVRAGLGAAQAGNAHAEGASNVGRSRLPAVIEGVLLGRLAKLSPEAQDLVSLASVIGRAFTFATLQVASEAGAGGSSQDTDRLVRALDELWRRRILREAGDDTYDFSHDKLREVANARLSATYRKMLHKKVGYALESIYSEHLDDVSAQIADHYERAGLPSSALPYFKRSAISAERVYANDEAISYYRRAITSLTSLPPGVPRDVSGSKYVTLFEMQEALADLLRLTGRYEEALVALLAAQGQITSLSGASERIAAARIQRKTGNIHTLLSRTEEAFSAYSAAEQALALEDYTPDDNQDVEVWRAWCDVQLDIAEFLYYVPADVLNMERLIAKARPVIERYGTDEHTAHLLHDFVQLDFRRNRYVVTSEDLLREDAELAFAERTGDLSMLASCYFQIGFRRLWYGDLSEAETRLKTSFQLANQTGNSARQVQCLTYLTIVCRKRRLVKEARNYAQISLAKASELNSQYYRGAAKANLCWVELEEGQTALAQGYGLEALKVWEGGNYPFLWLALFPLARIALQEDRTREAAGYLVVLLNIVQQRMPADIEKTLEALAFASSENNWIAAERLAQQAVEQARSMGYL